MCQGTDVSQWQNMIKSGEGAGTVAIEHTLLRARGAGMFTGAIAALIVSCVASSALPRVDNRYVDGGPRLFRSKANLRRVGRKGQKNLPYMPTGAMQN